MAWFAPAGKALTTVLATKAEGQEDAKAFLLTVRPAGLEPAEATLPADGYLVVVQNRSGLRGVTLWLDEEKRGRLLEMTLKARLDWRRRVNLPPGNYTITAADHPEWVCHITVAP